ncbi:MAG: biotin/lipoyl-binding protein [Hyphomicrobiales bacterium]|nr:biotin/lipoyl-binding protein [Hyphomicrobiales bacterium]
MMKDFSGRFRTTAILLLVVLSGVGAYAWRSRHQAEAGKQAQNARPAAPVSVATIVTGTFPVDIQSIGSVQALNTVAIRSRVDGQIEKIFFKEGQMAKAGDLLVQLDARPFQATLDQALAKKAQDEATLNNARLDLARYS